jgi:hypothetical protein
VIINDGVIVGSASAGNPAFDVGAWPTGFTPLLQLNGRIQGRGGNGGNLSSWPGGDSTVAPGFDGGVALFARHDIDVEYGSEAEIFGGAGGGASIVGDGPSITVGGGGAAGQLPGNGESGSQASGFRGTTDDGGDGAEVPFAFAGDGGDPGADGDGGVVFGFELGGGGAAGAAIDGDSFINVVSGTADIRGDQIN